MKQDETAYYKLKGVQIKQHFFYSNELVIHQSNTYRLNLYTQSIVT